MEWKIGSIQGAQPKEKIQYISLQRKGDDEEAKRLWNLMVNTLRDNGLMKDKGEE